MSSLFESAGNFNQPIGNWNTENVTDMSSMFSNATRFNQPIENWNTENVTDMSQMFQYTPAFNQPIGNWNTQNVTNMSRMFEINGFYPSNYFNQDIGNWNTENVTDMSGMFLENYVFNQDIGNWNTQNVTDMSRMFFQAYAFNQNLGNWNIENIVQNTVFDDGMAIMLSSSGLSTANYDATLIGWAAQSVNAGVNLGADGLTYCASETARNTLTSASNNWNIRGDTQQCRPFRTTWMTTDGTITIPTNGTGYNYTVTWTNLTNTGVGDGSATAQTGNYTITGLENNSTYEVAISGDFPHFSMNFGSSRLKLRTIEEWGTNPWTSMENAFFGSVNLIYNATDSPNLSGVTNMSAMFRVCSSFDGNAILNKNWF